MNFQTILNAITSIVGNNRVATPGPISVPTGAKYPPRKAENIIWTPTANIQKDPNRIIKYLIIHSTGGTAKSAISWMTNPEAKVSAHYLIDKSGTVYQLADEKDITWHAGKSQWGADVGLNHISVGVELENLNDGADTYSNEQICTAVWLSNAICVRHGIAFENVLRHLDIAPGRKFDPVNFPWSDFLDSVRRA
jgi:N-acetyl-anhydromuramyl-L-alanine amidase AmpD